MGTFTWETGLLFLAIGVMFILIAGMVIVHVININEQRQQEIETEKQREKIYGSK